MKTVQRLARGIVTAMESGRGTVRKTPLTRGEAVSRLAAPLLSGRATRRSCRLVVAPDAYARGPQRRSEQALILNVSNHYLW